MIRNEQGLNIRLAFKPGIDLAQMLLERRAMMAGFAPSLKVPRRRIMASCDASTSGQGPLHEDNAVLVSAGESEQKA